MKLWQQGCVLIGLPLLFQVVFAALLIANLRNIDSAINRETSSKKILATCRELRIIVDRFMLCESAENYISPKTTIEAKEATYRGLQNQLQVLDSVGGLDPKAKSIIAKYRKDILKLTEMISYVDSASAKDHRFSVARFENRLEYYEELSPCVYALMEDDTRIKEYFTPIAQEFSPQALKERQQMIFLIMTGIAGNIMLAAVLAVFYGKKTLQRFDVLTNNIKTFSAGQKRLTALDGNDELADLGRSFNTMAEDKLRADELRETLLSMISHDLRSPLSSCSISLSTLLEKQPDTLSPPALRQVRRVNSELIRLIRMADGLLIVGKSTHENIEIHTSVVKLDDVIEPTLNAVRGLADLKNISIELVLDGELEVACDCDKTIQVLVNLLSNSLKFSPKESEIIVRAELKTDPQRLRVEVIDHGPGVPADMQNKLFQKFVQLEQPLEIKTIGSGLGLYISKLLVSAHGGEIGYLSPNEGGACFWFELPQGIPTGIQH